MKTTTMLLYTGLVLLRASAQAQVYDLKADFSTTSNPNGVWNFGWSEGISGTLVLFPRQHIPRVNNDLEEMWDDPANSFGFTPSVARNSGGDFDDGNVTFTAGTIILHPCGTAGDAFAHVVWTAPRIGRYMVNSRFFAQQNRINVDVHVLTNGVSVFDDTITENGLSRSFSQQFTLSAGDTVDFAVGPNDNFSLHPGNTGLDARITPITSIASPEPQLVTTERRALFSLSKTDASPSLVGQFGAPIVVFDLAYDSQHDILYGAGNPNESGPSEYNLYTIDRASGAARLIGPIGVRLMYGLAYDEINGVLYGATASNSKLYRINTTTGEATLVGSIGNFFPSSGDAINGLAFNPADNALYGCISGASYLGGLVRIDTATGEGTFLYETQPLMDIAFDPQTGTLYGLDNGIGLHPAGLYRIDLATGVASLVGLPAFGGDNQGLAFVGRMGPRLSAVPLSFPRLQITWPANYVDYVLESSTGVPAASWTPVTNSVAVSGGQFVVTLVTDTPQQIFRLRSR